jgi:pimeloyl-ACP methyl ester carboxylesterase
VIVERYLVDNGAGWRLSLARYREAQRPVGEPVLVVPGYGMNSFIFGFHPNGPSMVECMALRGLEVWTMDLRGQGRSIRARGNSRFGLADLAADDIGAALRFVLGTTATGATKVDLVGVSLGVAIALGHRALVPDAPIGSIVAMAGLVHWRELHPLVRFAFASPRLAGLLRVKNTRRIARLALPVLTRAAPALLSVYLNASSTDLSQAARLVQAVEDPHPVINREIAEWMAHGPLVLRGVDVSAAIASFENPFMCVVAAADGIVAPANSRDLYDRIGSPQKEMLIVGDAAMTIGHADLFLCRGAQTRVFAPIADFLRAQAPAASSS